MNKYYVYTVNSDEPFIVRTTSDLQQNYISAIVETNGVGTWRFEYEGEEKPGRTPTNYNSVFRLEHIVSIVKIIE